MPHGIGVGIGRHACRPQSGNLRDEIKDKLQISPTRLEKSSLSQRPAVHFYDDMAAKGAEAPDHAKTSCLK
jgi:hypothetical protein